MGLPGERLLADLLKRGRVTWAEHDAAAVAFYGPRHSHPDEHHFSYLQRGQTSIKLGERVMRVEAGMALFCPAGLVHDAPRLSRPEDYLDLLELKFALPGKPELPAAVIVAWPDEFVSVFRGLIREFRMNLRHRNLVLRSHLAHLAALCLRSDARGCPNLPRSLARIKRYRACSEQAILLMRQRFTEPLSLADLAGELGVSVSTLSHAFKAHTGLSPMRYLIDYRLSKALSLMASTDLKLAAIATNTGFAGEYYLSRAFQRRYGLPPRRYVEVAARRG